MFYRFFLISMFLFTGIASSHKWYTELENPVTHLGCCGNSHCIKLDNLNRLVETEDEFILDGKYHFKKSEAMPSEDGSYHYCIIADNPRCFFYPTSV